MRRRTVNLIALAALGSIAPPLVAKEKSADEADVSFASQDEVIEHLIAALRNADFPAAIAAFGIERRAADHSFVRMAERMGSISLMTAAPPTQFDFYRHAAQAQFTHEAGTQLRNLVYSLLAPSGTPLDTLINFTEGQDVGQAARDLAAALDPARLAHLKVLRTVDPYAEFAGSEQHRRLVTSLVGVSGGDDLEERLVLLDLDGATYRAGMPLARSGENWLLRSLFASLGGTSPAGHAVPMTVEEFVS